MILFLAFTLVPAVEIYLLIQIGQVVGGLETFFLILITGMVGANLARSQGFALLRKIEQESQMGFPKSTTVAEGILILIGGVLLITPGVITDILGLLFIFPLSRKILAPRVLKNLQNRAQVRYGSAQGGWPPMPPGMAAENDPEADSDPESHFKHPIH
jgi:UPF0716 protein FxsA